MKSLAKSSSEGFQRVVVRIEGDFSDRCRAVSQLKCRTLQLQPPPHRGGSLFHERSKQAVELCPALVGLP